MPARSRSSTPPAPRTSSSTSWAGTTNLPFLVAWDLPGNEDLCHATFEVGPEAPAAVGAPPRAQPRHPLRAEDVREARPPRHRRRGRGHRGAPGRPEASRQGRLEGHHPPQQGLAQEVAPGPGLQQGQSVSLGLAEASLPDQSYFMPPETTPRTVRTSDSGWNGLRT